MLDFVKLLPHIREMVAEQARLRPFMDGGAESARDAMEALAKSDWQAVSTKIRSLPLSHLMATFAEPPDSRTSRPRKPGHHTVVATDGSQIPADRHEIVFCYLLNVGTVYLPYGAPDDTLLSSFPTLRFREEDLLEDQDGELQTITPKRIASRRLQAECQALMELIERAAARGEPAVALMDGTLILWSLEAESAGIRREILGEFNRLLTRARELRIPVAGYISRPGSSDVVNSLRTWRCGFCPVNCSAGRNGPESAPCRDLQRTTDLMLFSHSLGEGQRSALFGSQSKILRDLPEPNRIQFFYLDTGKEIARVEIPVWVGEDQELLELVHGVVLDQVDKGLGYPRALIEAHEKAVVRAPERAAFFQFVQREMAQARIPTSVTQKQSSKRLRSV